MGNAAGKHHSGRRKYVHWDSAVPPAPPGKPQLVPGTPNTQPDLVTISWEPPINDGGAPVTGYLVEHRRTGSPHWVRSAPALVPVPELTLSGLEPGWRYQFRVSAQNAAGLSEPGDVSEPLTVTLNRSAASAPHFVQELHDTIALENETAEFKVHFKGTPTPKLAWYKDGFEIFSTRRMKVVTEGDVSSLVIFQTAFSDEGEIKCTATNRVGHVVTRAKLRLEAPPSIRIPRQYEDGLLFEMGEIIRLKVSVAGRPLPRVTWFHNGEQVMFGGRYEVTNTDRSSSIRVAEARRADRGEYQVRATNRLGEDVASFLVTVTDRPMPPGKAQVVTTLGRSVTLSWTMPEDDGGCKIGNYIVEYYRIGWNVWLKAATCRQLSTTLGDLIEGSEYKFRVKAENPYGVSDPSEESDVVFIPDPRRGLLEPPARKRGSKTDVKAEDRKLQRPGSGRTTPQPTEDRVITKKEIPLAGKRKELKDVSEPPKKGVPDIRLVRSKEWETIDRPIPVIMFDDKKHPEAVKRKSKENVVKNTEEILLRVTKPDMKRKEEEPPPVPPKTMHKSTTSRTQTQAVHDRTQTKPHVKAQEIAVPKTKPSILTTAAKRTGEDEPKKETVFDDKAKRSHLLSPNTPLTPREDDDSIMHGSSELMLVLLPEGESRGAHREGRAQSERRSEFGNTFQESESLVAPPMSLSAPELGSGEPPVTNLLRNAVSSTELLHEKAMARFYQAVAAEEAEKARKRRQDIERPVTTPVRSRISSVDDEEELRRVLKIRDLGRGQMSSLEDENNAFKEKPSQNQKGKPALLEKEVGNKTELKPVTLQGKKEAPRLLSEEEEQKEFARIREKLNSRENTRERRERMRQASEEEETEEDEDEDLDNEESLDASVEYEDDEDEPYHPRSFIPETELRPKLEPAFPSFERDVYSDEEEETYHPRTMIPRQIITISIPAKTEVKPEVTPESIPKQTKDEKRRDEPLLIPQPEETLRQPLSGPEVLRSSKSPSPTNGTAESDIVVRRRKKEPPPTQSNEGVGSGKEEAQLQDDDVGVSAAEIARKRRLQARQSSLEEEAQLQRAVSSHYDDFIRDYGRAKRRQVQLYTNTEELKAAAFSSGEDVNTEFIVTETTQREEPKTNSSTLLQDYEERWQILQQKQKELGLKLETNDEIKHTKSYEPNSERPQSFKKKETESKREDKEEKEKKILTEVLEEKTEIPKKKWWWQKDSSTEDNPKVKEEEEEDEERDEVKEHGMESQNHAERVESFKKKWWWQRETSTASKPIEKEEEENSLSKHHEETVGSPKKTWWWQKSSSVDGKEKTETLPLNAPMREASPVCEVEEPVSDSSQRVLSPDEIRLQLAERNVRSFIEYISDLAMFSVACCLYLFENELLAVPLLFLMVYRQVCQAVKKKIPARWKRQR